MAAVNKFIVSSPVWSLNGVNVFSANLVRGLRERGVDARVLLTHPRQPDRKPMALPADIPIERLGDASPSTRDRRLRLLAEYLGDNAPCVYLPNHDFEHSQVCARLGDGVRVAAIVHSHEPVHYAHAARLGPYSEAIIAVSDQTGREFRRRQPALTGKLQLIPYGVDIPAAPPVRHPVQQRLEMVYAGRLVKGQKRVMDLARVAIRLWRRNIDFRLTIAGGGPARDELLDLLQPLLASGQARLPGIVSRDKLVELFSLSHVVMLTSGFEGLPLCLLEGMAHGCVPVAPDIPSVAPSPVVHGHNGYVVAVGDIGGYVERCAELQRTPRRLHALSINAAATVAGRFSRDAMVTKYLDMFEAAPEKC